MVFSIITWNVWFDLHHVMERINCQIDEILKHNPHVVCFQEITDTILDIIKKRKDLNTRYVVVSDEHSTKPYGEIMLLNRSLESNYKYFSMPFPETNMSRRVSVLFIEKHDICIMNTHLESEFNRGKIKEEDRNITKQKQASYMFKYAQYVLSKKLAKYVIMVGDMNISNEDNNWMNKLIAQYNIRDSFILSSSSEISPNDVNTYDCEKNTNVLGKYKARLDRILLLDYDSQMNPIYYKLIGTKPFNVNNHGKAELCFPSDHFGVFVTLAIN